MPRIPCCTASRAAGREAPVSFLAGSASERTGRQQTRIDVPICGLCPPMLFERISTVAVPVKMTPIRSASGPLATPDTRERIRVGKPSIRSATGRRRRRGSVSARAGPVAW